MTWLDLSRVMIIQLSSESSDQVTESFAYIHPCVCALFVVPLLIHIVISSFVDPDDYQEYLVFVRYGSG